MNFPNYAARYDVDDQIAAELTAAGIEVGRLPEQTRYHHPEVRTVVVGALRGWTFRRAWYYWEAKAPAILDLDAAEQLHAQHGKSVRVAGHASAPSPREWYKGPREMYRGCYHVDSQEGLNALADTIRSVVQPTTVTA